jgi:methyl-accepting chemotaxis protein
MSEEENIDAYLSSREREHREEQGQSELEPSVAGGVYKAVVEGEETGEREEPSVSTVGQPQPKTQSKRASIRKIQKSISDVSKQLDKQTAQINKLSQVVQTLQKQTKSTQRQSELTNQIRSQVNQIQRGITQVQKTVQKKAPAPSASKSVKKKSTKKKKK